MSKSGWGMLVLGTSLLVSNLWWAGMLLDAGITQTYMGDSLDRNRTALAQAIAVAESAAREDASREDVIAAASRHADAPERIFEKEGFLWIGQIGLRFDDAGRLAKMERAWDPP